ncbi:MAG: AI-2E family transporter [Stellaceae bacterium]
MSDAARPPELGPPPPELPPAQTPNTSVLSGTVVAVVIVAALYFASEVLIPITVALLLSFLLSPLVELLRRIRLGRILSVVLAVLLALGVITAVGSAIGTQVAQLAKNIPQYQTTIEQKITNLREITIQRVAGSIKSISHQLAPGAEQPPTSGPPVAAAGPQGEQKEPVPVVVAEHTPSALQIGEKVLSPLLHPVATAGIILVVTIFTLLQKEDLRDRAIRLFGSSDLHRTTLAMNDAGWRLSRYFLTQLGLNTSFGVIVAIGLYFIGVPNPVLWGILGALLRFIPYIGSWIAAALPIALAAAVEPGWSMAIWTAALYIVTELIMGQLVEPMVYGHTTGLSPLAVVIAAIFWTWIWGPIGLIISTPITLCLVVLGRHVEHLEFFDVLFGDRPALSPVESFYQRMLARDPDEAEEQAERYLADHPLSSYYDEVVLKALRLAASDVERGTLMPLQLERFKTSVSELIEDIGRYDDSPPPAGEAEVTIAGPTVDQQALPKEPPPAGDVFDKSELAPEWREETPVLCVAGRGPLDEAASTMLAQLIVKHGLGARVVPHAMTSRSAIGSVNFRGVAMICISYVEISGNPAHLRFLVRRLRERAPKVLLLVGLWPTEDPILGDRTLRLTLGVTYCASSLHDAVEACLATARRASRSKPRLVTPAEEVSPG